MVLGSGQQSKVRAAAEQAGVELASPMAVAITQQRLLTLELGSTMGMGAGGAVKKLLSSVPIADVDAIEIKRLALGKVVKLKIRGAEIKLEANAMADAKALVAALDSARGDGGGVAGTAS